MRFGRLAFAVFTSLAVPALADTVSCDSAPFTLDTRIASTGNGDSGLFTLDTRITSTAGGDSGSFVLDTRGNEGTQSYGDSGFFALDTTHPLLTVISAYGGTTPGSIMTNSGTAICEWITNSPLLNGTTQYLCTGGAVAGNAFTLVNATNVTLTLTNDATLTWQWQTQYLLTTAASGPGSVTPGGWCNIGDSAVLTATPGANAHFVFWSGDTNGCTIAGNVLTAPMTQARAITANFAIDQKMLTVISAQGGALPGTLIAGFGTPIGAWVTNSPVYNGTTQYVCTGATVAGNDFTLVSATNVTLTLTNNATLTWTWACYYWLEVDLGDSGALGPASGWYPAGSTQTVSYVLNGPGVMTVNTTPNSGTLSPMVNSGGLSPDALQISVVSNTVHLSMQLETSPDLQPTTWTNAGPAVEWVMPAETNKAFYRVGLRTYP